MTTTDEHFGLLGALATSGRAGSSSSRPSPDAIRAAVTPRTRLLALSQVIWTTGRILPVRELREETGHPRARRRCPVGGRDPRRCGRIRLPHDLRSEVALRAGLDRGARRRRSGAPESLGTELLLAGRATSRTGSSSRSPARPASTPAGGPRRRSRACWRRSTAARPGPSTMPPPSPSAAASSSPAGSGRVEVVSPAEGERSTLVAFRPAGEPAEIVEALYDAGVARARDPGHRPDPRLLRLVDLGRRSRPPARRRCPRDARGLLSLRRCPLRDLRPRPRRDRLPLRRRAGRRRAGRGRRRPPTGAISPSATRRR